jgi:hypothetical protein
MHWRQNTLRTWGHNGLLGKADKRTQQAVIMSLIIIGEAATKVLGPDRIYSHP